MEPRAKAGFLFKDASILKKVRINTCKLPTETFFEDYMEVPLLMEPNFSDYSCQFKFGIRPPLPEDDNTLKEPGLKICPTSIGRNIAVQNYKNRPMSKSISCKRLWLEHE